MADTSFEDARKSAMKSVSFDSMDTPPSPRGSVRDSTMNFNRNQKTTIRDHKMYEISLMQNIIEDTGKWAYGLIGVGLWIFCPKQEKIYLAEGGQWIERALHEPFGCDGSVDVPHNDCSVCVIHNHNNNNFVPAPEYSPGVGIPGVLWAETESGVAKHAHRGRSDSKDGKVDHFETKLTKLEWRDAVALSQDPDQPYDERLQQLVKIGVGWVSAVPFAINGNVGMIIFYARESVNLVLLESGSNTQYLLAAADFIGSAFALRESRMSAILEREARLKKNIRRIRAKMMVLVCMGKTLEDIKEKRAIEETLRAAEEQSAKHGGSNLITQTVREKTKLVADKGKFVRDKTFEQTIRVKTVADSKLRTTFKKCMGANIKSPPAFTWEASIYSCIGSTLTVWCIFALKTHLTETYDSEWSIITLGPLMSATVSIYVLTAAPASQPRNTFMAHLMAMIIGLIMSYTKTFFPLWVRRGFAVGLYAGLTTKFGFIHAPASGLAMAFASGTPDNPRWTNLLAQLASILIIVTMGSVYNNLHPKRQYPTSWGFRKFNTWVGTQWKKMRAKKKEKDDDDDDKIEQDLEILETAPA